MIVGLAISVIPFLGSVMNATESQDTLQDMATKGWPSFAENLFFKKPSQGNERIDTYGWLEINYYIGLVNEKDKWEKLDPSNFNIQSLPIPLPRTTPNLKTLDISNNPRLSISDDDINQLNK